MSFYVTLPSNSSMNTYPDNKIGSYTTKLLNPIYLDGDWEVGLSEIMYPVDWQSLQDEYVLFTKKTQQGITTTDTIKISLKVYAFDTINSVLIRLQSLMNEHGISILTQFNVQKREFLISFIKMVNISTMFFSLGLQKLFGIKKPLIEKVDSLKEIRTTIDYYLDPINAFYI